METKLLQKEQISEVATLLQQGELIGLPTETVYGLAADGTNTQAVAKIFQSKGRPSDNPLILHLGDASWISRYCKNIPPITWVCTKHFWPGPLTLILDCQDNIPEIVTAGLPSVGVRCPSHPLALATLLASNLPLAAPSGNLSGKPSPTTAKAMLEDMNGKIPAILEGGTCSVGVESTILDIRNKPTLLRIGGVSLEALQSVIEEEIFIDPSLINPTMGQDDTQKPLAPGMKYRHYAPEAPMTVVEGKNSHQWILQQAKTGDGVICFEEYLSLFPHCQTQSLGKEHSFPSQAQAVFSALRYFDQTNVPHIWSQCPIEKDLGQAVAQRLKKAAAFHVIHREELP